MPTPVQSTKTNGSVDEKLGIATVEISYLVDDFPTAIGFYPAPPGNVILVRRHFTQQEGGKFDVVFVYEGAISPNALGEDFSLEGTLSEDPIETFPDQDTINKYQGNLDGNGNLIFPQTLGGIPGIPSTDDGSGPKNPLFGQKTWLNPGAVWSHTIVRPVLPPDLLDGFGSIGTPESGSLGRIPPQLNGQRNWLYIRCEARWRGNVWQITKSWQLSGKEFGGWNEDIYRNNPGG